RVILKRMSEGRTFCAFTCEAIRHGDQPVRSTPDVAALKMGIKKVHRPLARITNEDRFPALFKNFISREYIFSASCPPRALCRPPTFFHDEEITLEFLRHFNPE